MKTAVTVPLSRRQGMGSRPLWKGWSKAEPGPALLCGGQKEDRTAGRLGQDAGWSF